MTNSNLVAVFNGIIAHQTVQLCNARELHTFLESKREYATWIKDRISDYGFIQDEDYIVTTERTAGRPRKEYYITLDMGKELGMVERNEKGRQIRRYFIECEKQARQQQLTLPQKQFSYELTEKELKTLAWTWAGLLRSNDLLRHIYPALNHLNANIAGSVGGQIKEFKRIIHESHIVIDCLTADLKIEPWGDEHWNRILPIIRRYAKY